MLWFLFDPNTNLKEQFQQNFSMIFIRWNSFLFFNEWSVKLYTKRQNVWLQDIGYLLQRGQLNDEMFYCFETQEVLLLAQRQSNPMPIGKFLSLGQSSLILKIAWERYQFWKHSVVERLFHWFSRCPCGLVDHGNIVKLYIMQFNF